MKLRATFSALVLAGLCAAGAGYAADTKTQPAPDTKTQPAADTKTQPAATPQEKAWTDWMQKNVPGPAHRMLAECEGEWTLQIKSWTTPDAQPTISTGKSSAKMILDGRYLEETTSGDMGGFPFTGQSLTAYDNASQKYQATWVDNMTTSIYHCDGTYDSATKSITMMGETYDPTVDKDVKVKTVTRFVDAKSHVFEWWGPDTKGKMFKSMEITYTRQ